MAFTHVLVTRDYDFADGLDPSGRVGFVPDQPMINSGVTIVAAMRWGQLDADGILSISLAANTDPGTTGGTRYWVWEDIAGQTIRRYQVVIPHDQGPTINLADLDVITDEPPPDSAVWAMLLAGKLDAEGARDAVAAALVEGPGISITADDGADTITIEATGGYTDEQARDAIGTALVGDGGVDITVDDGADTITVDGSALMPTAGGTFTGAVVVDADLTVRGVGGAVLALKAEGDDVNALSYDAALDGPNLSGWLGVGITRAADATGAVLRPYDGDPEGNVVGNPGDLCLSTTGALYVKASGTATDTGWVELGGGGYSDEQARDALGAALVEAGYVDITVDDGADTITIGTTSGLQTALDGKAATSHTHVYSDLPLVKDPPATLTYASPITWSAGSGGYRVCTMTGSATLNIPSGGTDGQKVWIRFIASGDSRTLTFHASYKRPAHIASTLVIPSGARGDVGLHYEDGFGWTVAAAQVVPA